MQYGGNNNNLSSSTSPPSGGAGGVAPMMSPIPNTTSSPSPPHSPPRTTPPSGGLFDAASTTPVGRNNYSTTSAALSGGGSPTPLQLRSYRSIREDLNKSSADASDAAAAARASAQQTMSAEIARQKELLVTIDGLKGQLLDKARSLEHLENVVLPRKESIIAQLQGELSETTAILRQKDGGNAQEVQLKTMADRDARLQQELKKRDDTIEALENQLRLQEMSHKRQQKSLADDVSQHTGNEETLSYELNKLKKKVAEMTMAEDAEQDRARRQLKQWRERFTLQSPVANSSVQSQLLAGDNTTDPALTQTPVPSTQYSPANARETLSLYLQKQCEVLIAGSSRLGSRVEELQNKIMTETSSRTSAESEQSRLRVLLETNAQNKRLSDSRQSGYFTEEDASGFSEDSLSPIHVVVTPETTLTGLSADLQRAYDDVAKLKVLSKTLKNTKDATMAQLRAAEETIAARSGPGGEDEERGMLKRSYDRVRSELVDLQNRLETTQQERDHLVQDLNAEKRRCARIQSEKDRKDEEMMTMLHRSGATSRNHNNNNNTSTASNFQQQGSPNRSAAGAIDSSVNESGVNMQRSSMMMSPGSPRTTIENQEEELESLRNALQQAQYEIRQLRKQLENEREGFEDNNHDTNGNESGSSTTRRGKVSIAIDEILKTKISALEQTQAESQRLATLLSSTQDALELERKERRAETIDRVERIDYLEDQVSQLSSAMNDSILQIQNLRTSLDAAENNLQITSTKEKRFADEIDLLREELDQIRSENTFYKTEIMDKELPSLKQHAESLSSLNKRLESNLKEVKHDFDAAEQQVMQLRIKLDRCEHDKESAREVASLAEDHVKTLTSEATSLSTQLGKLEVLHAEEKSVNKNLMNQIASLTESTIPQQQAQLVETQAKLKEATKQAEANMNARNQIESQLEVMTVRFDKTESELRRQEELGKLANHRVSTLENTVALQAETCERVHTLQGENDGLRKVIASKDEAIERLEGTVAEKRAVEEELWELKFRETPRLQTKQKELLEKTTKLERETSVLQVDKDAAEKEQIRLVGLLQAADRDKEVAQADLIALRQELEGGNNNGNVNTSSSSSSSGGLRSRLAEAEAELRHKSALQGELEGVKQVVEELREERTVLLENLKKSDSERSWLQSHLYGNNGVPVDINTVATSSSSFGSPTRNAQSPNRSINNISMRSTTTSSSTDVVALVPNLQKQIKELKVHASARQEMLNTLQDELDVKAEKIRQLVRQMNELRSAKAESDGRVQCLSEELADVSAQLDATKMALTKLKEDTDAERKRREELLRVAREERRQAVGDFMERGEDLEEERRRRSRAEAASESFQAAFAASEFKVGSLSTDLTQLQQQYNKLLDRFDAKNAQESAARNNNNNTTSANVNASTRNSTYHRDATVTNNASYDTSADVSVTRNVDESSSSLRNSSAINRAPVFISPQRNSNLGSSW